mmetsp:Transcript_37540/g.96006  ORF Transcript_37540/g.96006 Transcript_37540/m.96006 type:complete len:128 (+) Transcript_37540:412-795(+)
MYYRGAAAAVIVYDITSEESFTRAQNWVKELQQQGNPNLIMALAGNKADLSDNRKVATETAQAYADQNGLFFLETSAKAATNVDDIFNTIAERLPKSAAPPTPSGGITLTGDAPEPQANKKSCCTMM